MNLNRILGTMNTPSDLEERKREGNIIRDTKKIFRLKKKIDKT